MSNLDKSVKEVSGPINVVRLEGEINSIKKVIYLFMDIHNDLYSQSECDNIFAKEIPQYLADNFLKMNKGNIIYDFFLEIQSYDLENVKYGFSFPMDTNFKQIYINSVRKFFSKTFNYDRETNKVSMSKILKNIRLHYIDVREYMFKNFDSKVNDLNYTIDNMHHSHNIHVNQLTYLINNLNDIKNNTMMLLDNAKIIKSKIIKYASDNVDENANYVEPMKYLINKISESYNHKSVQEKMLFRLDIMTKKFDALVLQCDEIINVIHNVENVINANPMHKLTEHPNYGLKYYYGIDQITINELILTLQKHSTDLQNKILEAFTLFMDIYFLRRFLDKNYITNAIVYTGAYHSLQYIEILTKDFDFKITHTSYSLISDMDKLNEEVLKREVATLSEIFFPPTLSQCSDVTNFPDSFL